jgi:flavin-dependent dehydrogenase
MVELMSEEIRDVVIVGGAFAGAATALLLRRECPALRVLVVEKAEEFDRKVGEATTEISGAFLTKRLGLTNHLMHHHVVKNGLRFWFEEGADTDWDRAGELGASFNVRLPSFQVDRQVLDEEVLRRAVEEGAELWRPAQVKNAEGAADGNTTLFTVEQEGTRRMVRARWVIDASGRAAWWARRHKLWQPLPEHPTKALWARYEGVADWDSWQWREEFLDFARRVQTSRTSATNHLVGRGWWCWFIPLKGGDTSVGLVYDERLFQPPEGSGPDGRIWNHLQNHPLGRRLMAHARVVEGDARSLGPLPYYAQEIAGPGWQLVGDAAGFMDPLYSAGLDYGAWTVSAAVRRLQAELAGEPFDLENLNANWRQSYRSWFEGIYLDKYEYLGDRRLMTAAYLMDLGLFFFGPVREVVRCARGGFAEFPFCGPVDRRVAKIMAFYNQRLAELARQKVHFGLYGEGNAGHRTLVPGFAPKPGVWRHILDGAALWAVEELRLLGLRCGLRRRSSARGNMSAAPATPSASATWQTEPSLLPYRANTATNKASNAP